MNQIEQLKIKSVYDNMYCVSMYIGGVVVDCVNGMTEAEKNEYVRLFKNGKLLTPQLCTK